jgi:transcriptional regulator with XRE-family HTH domain
MTKPIPARITVADFIADRLAESDKTQREIAEECGFLTPNIITMFKKGDTKVPINRIGSLAKALGVDPAYLLRLVMSEYLPDAWDAIEDILKSTILSANELHLVREYRRAVGDNDAVPMVINRDAVIAIVAA